MNGTDYLATGRTVDRLNIAGMTVRDLRLLAIGESQGNGVAPSDVEI
jgi:hypothetical protein